MTLSLPSLELPGILLAIGIALVVGMAIGSAATASIMQRKSKPEA